MATYLWPMQFRSLMFKFVLIVALFVTPKSYRPLFLFYLKIMESGHDPFKEINFIDNYQLVVVGADS